MSLLFEELDYCPTPIGLLTLRRRREPVTNTDIFEVKLGDEHLMSSLFTASELALARLGIAALAGDELDVAIGGLGLGYTATAALESSRVREVLVIEMLAPVIEWHANGLLPVSAGLTGDARCQFLEGDFFTLAQSDSGLDPERPERAFDAILVDIDHSPDALLDERSRPFYQPAGLRRLATHLKPGGIFGLWSNDMPDNTFVARLETVFADAWAEPVVFSNPLQNRDVTQTVYLARR